MKKKYLIFLFFLISIQTIFGATIKGEVFEWYSLKRLDGVIIEINTTPIQRIVSQNGSYEMEVPPGNYKINAKYYSGNELYYETDENVSVQKEGIFNLDLILFPVLDLEEPELTYLDEELDSDLITGQTTLITKNKKDENLVSKLLNSLPLLGLIVLIIVIGFFVFQRNFSNPENQKQETKIQPKEDKELLEKVLEKHKYSQDDTELDNYALEVLEVLKKSGNRLTQKKLREKISSVGEAKISLIVSELESLGKVKKIKQGRGNIIILKEK